MAGEGTIVTQVGMWWARKGLRGCEQQGLCYQQNRIELRSLQHRGMYRAVPAGQCCGLAGKWACVGATNADRMGGRWEELVACEHLQGCSLFGMMADAAAEG